MHKLFKEVHVCLVSSMENVIIDGNEAFHDINALNAVDLKTLKTASPFPHPDKCLPACVWLSLLKGIGKLSNLHNK